MITVANRTETAARITYALNHDKVRIKELCDPERTLHIDSKVLEAAEAQEEPVAPTATGGGEDEEATSPQPRSSLRRSRQSSCVRRSIPLGSAASRAHRSRA